MVARPSICATLLAVAASLALLLLSGVVEITFSLQGATWALKERHLTDGHLATEHVQSFSSALDVLPAATDIVRRKLLGTRKLRYSIYTGLDRAARDLNQIERALERLKGIERGVSTQVCPPSYSSPSVHGMRAQIKHNTWTWSGNKPESVSGRGFAIKQHQKSMQ
jgi:hypothetical protein